MNNNNPSLNWNGNISIGVGNSTTSWVSNTGIDMNRETVKVILVNDGDIEHRTMSDRDYQHIKNRGVDMLYDYIRRTEFDLPIASIEHNVVSDSLKVWRFMDRALKYQANIYMPFVVWPTGIPFPVYIGDTLY